MLLLQKVQVELNELSTTGSAVGHITVYKFTAPITEAEVQVKGTTGVGVTEVTGRFLLPTMHIHFQPKKATMLSST